MMEKITAFFKQRWPDAATNAPLVVAATVLAVALVIAFLSLWLAKITGVSDGFLRLVESVLSPTVVFVGIIAGAFVWFVNKFPKEISGLIRRLKKIAGMEFHEQDFASKSEFASINVSAKEKADEESIEKIPMSAPVTADKGASGAKSVTAKKTLTSDSFDEIKSKAEAGNAVAQFNLGQMYASGKGVTRDDADAVKWYCLAAKQGYDAAQNNLGVRYANGRGVERDEAKAVEWFRRAANNGNATAQNNLGARYADGRGVERDEAKAVEWFRRAANNGNAKAQNNLGARHADGRGVERDEAKAVEWFRRAANNGNAKAQNNLGARHANGRGVERDEAKAVEWFRLAADNGNAQAQNNLGVRYANGRGVERDEVKAVEWFRLAADNGNAQAQGNLGAAYHNGKGVAQNYREAYVWHSIAAANGVESSEKYRDEDAKLLSAEDLAKAQAEATRRLGEIRKRAESGK